MNLFGPKFSTGPIKAVVEIVRSWQRPGMCVAEIGCYDGSTAEAWMEIVAANHGSAILVDYFKGTPGLVEGNPHGESAYDPEGVRDRLAKRMRKYSNVTIMNGDSAAMAQEVRDASLDVCFIDADHRYSHVSRDIDAWRPKVRPGGILCGHDCESLKWDERYIELDVERGNHHGVAKAVTERFGNVSLLGDAVWAVNV